MQEYLRTYCEPDEDGFIPLDGGSIFTFEDGTSIESHGGYCEDYEEIIPDDEVDILLIDYEGVTIPLIYFSISYDTPLDPSQNWYCDDVTLPFPVTEYRLPKEAYIWNTTKELNEDMTDEGYVNFTVYHIENGFKRVCFSYGTKEEYDTYNSRKDNFFIFFAGICLALVALFCGIFYATTSYTRELNKWVHLLFLVLLTISWLIFRNLIIRYFNIIPPFSHDYLILIFISFVFAIIIYLLSLLPFFWLFTKCKHCGKYLRKKGLAQHITTNHR